MDLVVTRAWLRAFGLFISQDWVFDLGGTNKTFFACFKDFEKTSFAYNMLATGSHQVIKTLTRWTFFVNFFGDFARGQWYQIALHFVQMLFLFDLLLFLPFFLLFLDTFVIWSVVDVYTSTTPSAIPGIMKIFTKCRIKINWTRIIQIPIFFLRPKEILLC